MKQQPDMGSRDRWCSVSSRPVPEHGTIVSGKKKKRKERATNRESVIYWQCLLSTGNVCGLRAIPTGYHMTPKEEGRLTCTESPSRITCFQVWPPQSMFMH